MTALFAELFGHYRGIGFVPSAGVDQSKARRRAIDELRILDEF